MSQGVDTLLDVSETISAEELVAEVVRQAEREKGSRERLLDEQLSDRGYGCAAHAA